MRTVGLAVPLKPPGAASPNPRRLGKRIIISSSPVAVVAVVVVVAVDVVVVVVAVSSPSHSSGSIPLNMG